MEETIELRQYFEILMKRIWIIVAVTLVATLTSGMVSFFVITPIYEASTQLLVNKSESKNEILMPDFNDIQTSLKLIETYSVIINSPRVLEKSIEEHRWDITSAELSKKIKVSPVQNSQVMSITVNDPDPNMAVEIANGIAGTFQKEIQSIMSVDNVQILAQAKVQENTSPVKPKPLLNMVIAFVVGLMTSIGIVFLLEYMDNTIKTEQDVENILGLSVLAAIATMDDQEKANEKVTAGTSVGGERVEA